MSNYFTTNVVLLTKFFHYYEIILGMNIKVKEVKYHIQFWSGQSQCNCEQCIFFTVKIIIKHITDKGLIGIIRQIIKKIRRKPKAVIHRKGYPNGSYPTKSNHGNTQSLDDIPSYNHQYDQNFKKLIISKVAKVMK